MTHASLPPFLKHLVVGAGVVAACACTIWLGARLRAHPAAHPAPDRTLAEYFHEAQQLAADRHASQQTTTTATFLAVGDISLSRSIAATIAAHADPLYPFHSIQNLLATTDFNFGNLESPFSSSNHYTASNTLVFNAPQANVAGLSAHTFKVLNLANNHASDQGLDGIRTTRRILDEHGILHMGTGETLDEAWTPAIYEVHGISIGFIGASYASINDGGKATTQYVARMEDISRLTAHISQLKSRADFIVVTMHAGIEYTSKPTQAQIDFAHAAIDAGADLVIGHHAHWVQEKELYCGKHDAALTEAGAARLSSRTLPDPAGSVIHSPFTISDRSNCKWIYYGLGNFIFDQSWSEQTKKGLALKITLSKTTAPAGIQGASTADLQPAGPQAGTRLVSIQEIPLYIEKNCCPVPLPTPTP